ncbi:AraC family transcriptional regulator [Sphingomonas profundi]|uniref:AraC family transcriptional regulator n=1 Tax=Alterirhizorhabdus profundi TaxID=2681549 RepID=UPI0018CFF738|nr:helix-turn-helix transcriptional regulator [Sphingomonas profundi]
MTPPVRGLTDEYAAGFTHPVHTHDRIQVLYACSGVMSVVTPSMSFVVPPQRALWLPAGMPHEVACRGAVSLRTLYIDPACYAQAPECRVIEVGDFLRALILKVVSFGDDYAMAGQAARIVEVLLDEIAAMPTAPYGATMPLDPRLKRVCRIILANPADNRDVDELARIAGMARRTFTRAFRRETGMGLATWRQQVRLMEALSLMAAGRPVTAIAFDVGYDSPSAFTAMFRRAYGVPPTLYALP